MNPKSFSATALEVAEQCLSRYKAEMVDRSRGVGGTAASLGTAVHGALENFVRITQLEGDLTKFNLPFLLDLFKISYMTTFSTSELATEEYFDGVSMLEAWFARNEHTWDGERRVISVEKKDFFPVSTALGEKPFNYIWDRFDYLGNDEYVVVDYKTNRWNFRHEDLKKKIQVRAYAVACAIQLHKQSITPKRIWVELDMLRHDGPIGVSFSREENVAMLKFIRETSKRIIDTPDEEATAQETLNPNCLFCVKKQTCKALLKNINVGGIFSIASNEEAVSLRAQLEYQLKAVNAAIKELDDKIISEAMQREETKFEDEFFEIAIGASRQRRADPERVEMAIGPHLFAKYGGKSFTMKAIDNLLKGNELTDAQKKDLLSIVYYSTGEPKVKVIPKSAID